MGCAPCQDSSQGLGIPTINHHLPLLVRRGKTQTIDGFLSLDPFHVPKCAKNDANCRLVLQFSLRTSPLPKTLLNKPFYPPQTWPQNSRRIFGVFFCAKKTWWAKLVSLYLCFPEKRSFQKELFNNKRPPTSIENCKKPPRGPKPAERGCVNLPSTYSKLAIPSWGFSDIVSLFMFMPNQKLGKMKHTVYKSSPTWYIIPFTSHLSTCILQGCEICATWSTTKNNKPLETIFDAFLKNVMVFVAIYDWTSLFAMFLVPAIHTVDGSATPNNPLGCIKPISVVSTHTKNHARQIGSFPICKGQKNKYLKPPRNPMNNDR